MRPRQIVEYRALRDTIRERGTARAWILVAGLVAWAGLVLATLALGVPPLATLLPLLVLAGVFEAVFALHVGVERIGRYIQVFFEEGGGWEQVAMAYGQSHRGGTDPLFTVFFLAATALNFMPVLLAEPVAIEVAALGAAHAGLAARILVACRTAARQRAVDLERFQQIKGASGPAQS